jgi:hypothetical protein
MYTSLAMLVSDIDNINLFYVETILLKIKTSHKIETLLFINIVNYNRVNL